MGGIFGGGSTSINTTEPMALGLRVQTSAYGLAIPIVYGRTRITGNLIWYGDFTPIPHTTSTSSGGGKGGGDVTSSNTSYTYNVAFALGLGEGQFSSVNAFWRDKDYFSTATQDIIANGSPVKAIETFTVPASGIITVANASNFVADVSVVASSGFQLQSYVYTVSKGVYTLNISPFYGAGMGFLGVSAGSQVTITYTYIPQVTISAKFNGFTGAYPQSAWTYLTTNHPDQAIRYAGVSYVAASAYDLGSNPSMMNHSFDVTGRLPFNIGAIDDANPKDVMYDFLTNPHYGAGFPSSKCGDWTQYSNYCVASGIFLSPAYTDQKAANQTITSLAQITNAGIYFSEGLLKVVPFGDATVTGNGVTYTPNITPIYDLGDDDYITNGNNDDPVKLLRNSTADSFNQVQVEYVNRLNQYNIEIAEAKDQVSIDTYGIRTMQPLTAHEIASPIVARTVAQLVLQRSLFVRNTYEFNLSWRYCLLEPTDYVTLTDANLGLNKYPVRILSIDENSDGMLTVTAEDAPAGISSNALYSTNAGVGYNVNYNANAGSTNAPVIFEAPDILTTSGLEIWIGAYGGPLWGGCQVWVSQDGVSYQQVGTITNPAKVGSLSATLQNGLDPDVVNTLSVNLSASRSTLNGGTQIDADNYNTLCYVGGELVSYQNATLVGANQYNLTYLRRGAYNTTISNHSVGDQFVRIDDAIFKLAFTADKIGKKIYIKLPSVNVYAGGAQSIADVDAIQYTITGSALSTALPNVQNIGTNFVAGLLNIYWSSVNDFRQPNIDYEVRIGATWASARVVGRTPLTNFTAVGNGVYWIAAHYQTSGGVNAYSLTPASIIVTGSALVRNVIASFDEYATGWTGSLSGNLINSGGNLELGATGNILTNSNVLTMSDLIWYGGVASAGTYTLPSSHSVNIGRVAPCVVSMSYTARGQSIFDNILKNANLLTVTDLLGAALGVEINIQPQIAIADSSGNYGSWQNFIAGTYNAQYFKARVVVTSSDPQVRAILSGFIFYVDVPDRIDSYQKTTSTSASTALTYSAPFNGGNGSASLPTVQATIIGAAQGDDVVISAQTLTGCSIDIYNAGIRVTRTINVQVQGY